jgi:hypothetical protein
MSGILPEKRQQIHPFMVQEGHNPQNIHIFLIFVNVDFPLSRKFYIFIYQPPQYCNELIEPPFFGGSN